MKTYTTLAGAHRAANGNPIVRLLTASEDEIFIVVPSHDAKVLVYTADSGHALSHRFAGSIKVLQIAAAGEAR